MFSKNKTKMHLNFVHLTCKLRFYWKGSWSPKLSSNSKNLKISKFSVPVVHYNAVISVQTLDTKHKIVRIWKSKFPYTWGFSHYWSNGSLWLFELFQYMQAPVDLSTVLTVMLNGGSDTFYASHIITKKKKKEKENKCRCYSSCFCKPSLMLLLRNMTGREMKCRIKGYTPLNSSCYWWLRKCSLPCSSLDFSVYTWWTKGLKYPKNISCGNDQHCLPGASVSEGSWTQDSWEQELRYLGAQHRHFWTLQALAMLRCRDRHVLGMMPPENK